MFLFHLPLLSCNCLLQYQHILFKSTPYTRSGEEILPSSHVKHLVPLPSPSDGWSRTSKQELPSLSEFPSLGQRSLMCLVMTNLTSEKLIWERGLPLTIVEETLMPMMTSPLVTITTSTTWMTTSHPLADGMPFSETSQSPESKRKRSGRSLNSTFPQPRWKTVLSTLVESPTSTEMTFGTWSWRYLTSHPLRRTLRLTESGVLVFR